MQRVAEVIYIVPEEREALLQKCLNPDEEVQQIFWMHGIRNQFYFLIDTVILMTFEYVGHDFHRDMAELAAYPKTKEYYVQTRRRDVPADKLTTTNWWAPLRRAGSILTKNPMPADAGKKYTIKESYRSQLSGFMWEIEEAEKEDYSFSEDDWSESVHF